jgi:ribonuclease HII
MLSIGIDEAGYGPLLGPLVVSAVAMTLPNERAGVPLWQLFPNGISYKVKNAGGKLVIADSKKVYRGNTGEIRELERSTLAAVVLMGQSPPEELGILLKAISLEPDPHLLHPWYSHQPLPLPCRVESTALKLSTGMISREMSVVGAKLIAVKSVPLVEKRYNYLVGQTRNKSEVVFSQTVRLIMEILKISPEKSVTVCVDKQGGKDCYVRNLLRAFPDAKLTIKTEGPDESAYTMDFEGRTISICFCKKGETKHMLIAWASIVSKYLREIFMHQFNAYWHAMDPSLEATAGYWEDGQRFMKAIEPLLKKANIPAEELIRQL